MTQFFKLAIKVMLICSAVALSNVVAAQPAAQKAADLPAPHQVIQNVTASLLAFVRENKELLKSDPTKYYDGIERIISPTINLEYITRKVMGAYWSKATPEQRQQFQDVFSRSMIVTYGKGMANYADITVSILPPEKEVPEYGGTVVRQNMQTNTGVETVTYFMGRAQGGDWQLINVVYEGVNLRDTSQGQFAQLASENNGDIAATIKGWKSSE